MTLNYIRRRLARLLKLVNTARNNIRWAGQRAFRGWDDTIVAWGIDRCLCQMMPVWLRQLQRSKPGIPLEFLRFSDDGSDVGEDQARAAWNAVLEEMAVGFEAGKRLLLEDLPIWKELELEGIDYVFLYDYDNAMERAGGVARVAREYNKLQNSLNHSLNLFRQYFLDLSSATSGPGCCNRRPARRRR